jgi:hypothetical protein
MIAIAIITFCLTILIFLITFVASRNPKPPGWASNMIIMNVWLPSIIGLMALGVSSLGFGLSPGSAPFTMTDFVLSLIAALLTIVVIMLIKPMKKLNFYSLQSKFLGKT